MPADPRIAEHQRWLNYLDREGLVVSPAALVDLQIFPDRDIAAKQLDFIDLATDCEAGPTFGDFRTFATAFLGWPEDRIVFPPPAALCVSLRELEEVLTPTFALAPQPIEQSGNLSAVASAKADPAIEQSPLLLVKEVEPAADLDRRTTGDQAAWSASETQRFVRLLQETEVPIGVLTNHREVRLIYAPKGESYGSITFKVREMTEVAGRPILAALLMLLGSRRLFVGPMERRLPGLLARSRQYQAQVSTALADQVIAAAYELLRGFQSAHERSRRELLGRVLADNRDEVYEGLLTVLMRLVFLLFAEDRDLMPSGGLYRDNYGIRGLWQRLGADADRYPDTMESRYGAWAQLLALFRIVYLGCEHPDLKLPAREGYLFDPDRFPWLEGRATPCEAIGNLPLVPDGHIFRALDRLLTLDSERLSYRTLDVEQIGSVYEVMMGFGIGIAEGTTVALKPKKRHGVPIPVELDALLKSSDRAKSLKDHADQELSGQAAAGLKSAHTIDDLLIALDRRIARFATPQPLPAGAMVLVPSDERRRSGSNYTPRSLTAPIVEKALAPVLARLGEDVRPEQILDLKICDPAMGSGAFLVEACRQLAAALGVAWHRHDCLPAIPPDEDELLFARRIVAQRCLYGVDKNPMAAHLAQLSVWLATLAKDHPFTFLEHNLRSGDSLVGLTRNQIVSFTWARDPAERGVLAALVEPKVDAAIEARKSILDAGDDMSPEQKLARLQEVDSQLDEVRAIGDLAIAAFFSGENARARARQRDEFFDLLTTQSGTVPLLGGASWSRSDLDARGQLPMQAVPTGATHGGRAAAVTKEAGLSLRHSAPAESEESSPEESMAPVQPISSREASPLRKAITALHSAPKPLIPFHWEIEFPEVFAPPPDRREGPGGGFDAIVGNPPFSGKNGIIDANREGYLDWVKVAHPESHGNADLVAHFFRRAFDLLRHDGSLGLIATNTIGQGDTRSTGLRWICSHRGTIYAATKRLKWPGAAAVVVSVVWIAKGRAEGPFDLDGRPVPIITAFLFHAGGHEDPARLVANEGKSFVGSYVLGMGFTFDDTDRGGVANPISEMHRLIEKDPRNAERIFPYIGGEEVNNHPEQLHHRYVINFGDMPLGRVSQLLPFSGQTVLDSVRRANRTPSDDWFPKPGSRWESAGLERHAKWRQLGVMPDDYVGEVAADWPDLLDIVERLVKPDRDPQNRDALRTRWWHYAEKRPGLQRAVGDLDHVLACPRYSPQWSTTFLPARTVSADTLIIFTSDKTAVLALLQSRIHEIWARFFGSSMKDDLRYAPSDCFETFPFPPNFETDPLLEEFGKTYYDLRAQLMIDNDEGLTKTYNRFHDPSERSPAILRLRELHADMDRAVLDAYGWTDIPTACQFLLDYEEDEEDSEEGTRRRKKPWRYRWPDDVRDEVLARLLALNAERAAEEASLVRPPSAIIYPQELEDPDV